MTMIHSRAGLSYVLDDAALQAHETSRALQKTVDDQQRDNLRSRRKTLRKSGFLRGLTKVLKGVAMVAGILLASAVTGGAALGVLAIYAGVAIAGGVGATAAAKSAQRGDLRQSQENQNVEEQSADLQQEADAFGSFWTQRFMSVWSSHG